MTEKGINTISVFVLYTNGQKITNVNMKKDIALACILKSNIFYEL
jgi:hypothetical protein